MKNFTYFSFLFFSFGKKFKVDLFVSPKCLLSLKLNSRFVQTKLRGGHLTRFLILSFLRPVRTEQNGCFYHFSVLGICLDSFFLVVTERFWSCRVKAAWSRPSSSVEFESFFKIVFRLSSKNFTKCFIFEF